MMLLVKPPPAVDAMVIRLPVCVSVMFDPDVIETAAVSPFTVFTMFGAEMFPRNDTAEAKVAPPPPTNILDDVRPPRNLDLAVAVTLLIVAVAPVIVRFAKFAVVEFTVRRLAVTGLPILTEPLGV